MECSKIRKPKIPKDPSHDEPEIVPSPCDTNQNVEPISNGSDIQSVLPTSKTSLENLLPPPTFFCNGNLNLDANSNGNDIQRDSYSVSGRLKTAQNEIQLSSTSLSVANQKPNSSASNGNILQSNSTDSEVAGPSRVITESQVLHSDINANMEFENDSIGSEVEADYNGNDIQLSDSVDTGESEELSESEEEEEIASPNTDSELISSSFESEDGPAIPDVLAKAHSSTNRKYSTIGIKSRMSTKEKTRIVKKYLNNLAKKHIPSISYTRPTHLAEEDEDSSESESEESDSDSETSEVTVATLSDSETSSEETISPPLKPIPFYDIRFHGGQIMRTNESKMRLIMNEDIGSLEETNMRINKRIMKKAIRRMDIPPKPPLQIGRKASLWYRFKRRFGLLPQDSRYKVYRDGRKYVVEFKKRNKKNKINRVRGQSDLTLTGIYEAEMMEKAAKERQREEELKRGRYKMPLKRRMEIYLHLKWSWFKGLFVKRREYTDF